MKTYRDLIVWQKSMVLVTEVYEISKKFPKDELYGLTSQIRRCAISVPSNLAEGYGRNSTNDSIHFLLGHECPVPVPLHFSGKGEND